MRNIPSVPWTGTAIQDSAFMQKVIRVISSAAICGMSFSFIVGEAVDHNAKDIHSWKSEPRLIPLSYLPMQPLAKSVEGLAFDKIAEAVWLSNSQIGQNNIVEAVAEKPSLYRDTLRTLLAAPALPPPSATNNPIAAAPKPEIDTNKDYVKDEIHLKELEAVVYSLNDATTLLAGKTPVSSIKRGAALVSRTSNKTIGGEEPEESVIVGGMMPSPSVRAPAEKSVAGQWMIRGRVIPDKSTEKGHQGHFEIGLFAKVDQDSVPVGFPIVQQILPSGTLNFELKVPAGVERGFLFGEFVQQGTGKRSWIAPPVNPWQKGDRQIAELRMDPQDKVSSVAAAAMAVESDVKLLKGVVTTYFEPSSAPLFQEDVVVKVRGRKESTRTTKSGEFSLEVPLWKGTLQLEFLKAGYHPLVVNVSPKEETQIKVKIASREAIDQIAGRLGVRQLSNKSIFLGRFVGSDGKGLKGGTIQMEARADGPFYFRENGQPAADRKASSTDGRFLFLNVEPGAGFAEASVNGESVSPFLVSTVEGGELIDKTLSLESGTISGKLFNPVSEKGRLTPITGARLRIEGDTDFTTTDALGAFSIGPIRWFKGERISLDLSAERFNNHRYLVSPNKKANNLSLFAFPALYFGRLARSMDVELDQGSGIILGRVSGMRLRLDALAEHSVVNGAKDFYFDAQGRLKGSHSATDPKFGTYVIFNVPKGRTLLHGQDGNGVLKYSESVISSPAAISVIMD